MNKLTTGVLLLALLSPLAQANTDAINELRRVNLLGYRCLIGLDLGYISKSCDAFNVEFNTFQIVFGEVELDRDSHLDNLIKESVLLKRTIQDRKTKAGYTPARFDY